MDTTRATVTVKQWTEFNDLGAVLDESLALLGGLESMISPGDTVVIKPNITADAPSSSGGTTHMELVEALVERAKACQPGSVIVAEGTGRFGATLESAFLNGGWREMAERQGVPLYNLDAGPYVDKQVEGGRYPDAMPFSELVLNADVFISVPCLKTHMSADYTVALKNSFSLTSQRKRSEIHREYRIEESLVDINRIRKPDLTVVDGWDGAEGIAGGTHFERPAKARLMILGQDPVAVDAICKQLMAFEPTTRYLKWAAQDGVGIGDLARIDVVGDPLSACQRRFLTASEELMETMPGLTLHDLGACSGCRVAATSAVRRFAEQKRFKPITLIYGGKGQVQDAPEEGVTLVVGNCARAHAHLGAHIQGCPPQMDAIVEALAESGAICQICKGLVAEIEPEIPASLRPHLRISAAGDEAFRGEAVERGSWHLELVVGECMHRYAGIIKDRGAQFGLDPERDVIWLDKCPPDVAEIHEALGRLEAARAEAMQTA